MDRPLLQFLGSNMSVLFLGLGGIWMVDHAQIIYYDYFKSSHIPDCPAYFAKHGLSCFKIYFDPGRYHCLLTYLFTKIETRFFTAYNIL